MASLPRTPVFKIGELHTIFYLCFLVLLVCFLVFALKSYTKNHKKIVALFLLVVADMGFTENIKLCDFTSHNDNDFMCTSIVASATGATSYEIKPALLNLVMKDQFSGVGDDAALHLNSSVELYDKQKYKEVDDDIVKLKPFPFSLRGGAKVWLQSLPRNSIDYWDKCKDAFIEKYYPPAKIIQLRSNIMNFR